MERTDTDVDGFLAAAGGPRGDVFRALLRRARELMPDAR